LFATDDKRIVAAVVREINKRLGTSLPTKKPHQAPVQAEDEPWVKPSAFRYGSVSVC